jgi:hypothetical protein
MRHEKIQGRLSAYLDGDVTPRERARLEGHLAECAACAAELQALRRTVDLLRRLPAPEPPSYFADRVLSAVRAAPSRPPLAERLHGLASGLLRGAWLAPLAAAAVGAALFVGVSGRESTLPTSVATSASERAWTTPSQAAATPPSAALGELAQLASTSPGTRRSGTEPTSPASTAPSESGARQALPSVEECITASHASGPVAVVQRTTCARWYAWMTSLASHDPTAFIQELEGLPASERARWLERLAEFATRSGSAPLLARELRAANDPRAPAIAIHFERSGPALR